MRFFIPKFNLPKLEKLVKRLKHKTDVQFEVFPNTERQTFITIDGVKYPYTEIEVDVDLDYKVGDYELVAQLEHTPQGNIIRKINPDKNVPNEYRNTGCYCDHCHTNRDRKNTFLLLGDNGEYKQVGKSCLNDYTGYNSESVAEAASSLYRIFQYAEMQNYDTDPEFMEFLKSQRHLYDETKELSNKYYQLLLDRGYNKYDPFEGIEEYSYKPELQNKVDELLNVVNTDWYDENNDYCHNCKVVTNLEYIEPRQRKILLSYLNSAMKYLERQNNIQNQTNEYLGNIGDKIEFTIQSLRVLFKGYDMYSGDDTYTYRFVTDTGNIVLWTTARILNDEYVGCKVRGTIKSLKEYKGEKQTVITRARVDDSELIKRKEREAEERLAREREERNKPENKVIYKGKEYNKDDANLALDQFLDFVDSDEVDWDNFEPTKNESYTIKNALNDLND